MRASVDVINSCKLNVDALFTYEVCDAHLFLAYAQPPSLTFVCLLLVFFLLLVLQGFLFGGEAKFNPNLSFKSEDKKEGDKKDTGFKVDDYNVALGYTGADFDLGVRR